MQPLKFYHPKRVRLVLQTMFFSEGKDCKNIDRSKNAQDGDPTKF